MSAPGPRAPRGLARLALGSLTVLALPGCPMTDDYFVDLAPAVSGGAASGDGGALGGQSPQSGGALALGGSSGGTGVGGLVATDGGSNAASGGLTGGGGIVSAGGATGAAGSVSSNGGTVHGGSSSEGGTSGGTPPSTGGTGGAGTGGSTGDGGVAGDAAGGAAGYPAGGAGGDAGGTNAGGSAGDAGGTNAGGDSGELGGAGGAGPAACDSSNCGSGCCGGECVNLKSDARHCGSCNAACSVGRNCVDSVCTKGWAPSSPPPPAFAAREKAAYAAFSGKVFIFGGLAAGGAALNSGAIYDPAADSWQLISVDPRTPSPRQLATAVWTGTALLVFGGRSQSGATSYRDGALYYPATDTWTSIADNVTARVAPVAGASAASVVFWGGWTAGLAASDRADRYTFGSGQWEPAPTQNAPDPLAHPAWAFSGTSLYVYGGRDESNNNFETDRAHRYSLTTNSWTSLSRGPSARWGAFGVWDGTNFTVWGGRTAFSVRNDGQTFGTLWSPISNLGAPSARWASFRESGWGFALGSGSVAFLAGLDVNGNVLRNGGRFERTFSRWTPITSWPSAEAHAFGVAAWTGTELFVWGGRDGFGPTATGERWAF